MPARSGPPAWVDANCFRCCLATLLRRRLTSIPDPTLLFRHPDWFERYDGELTRKLGLRLEEIPAHACAAPRIGVNEQWIAVLDLGDAIADHAVIANGQGFIRHDPNDTQLNGSRVKHHKLVCEPSRRRRRLPGELPPIPRHSREW
jgi:hypothetical protein